MVSLLAETYGNHLKTVGNQEINSNFKRMLNGLLREKVNSFIRLKNTKANFSFEEKGTDVLGKIRYSSMIEDELIREGYKNSTQESYSTEHFNSVYSEKTVLISDSETNILPIIKLNTFDGEKNFIYFNDIKTIIFYPDGETKAHYFWDFLDVELLDFKIDKELFAYFLYTKEGKKYVSISHLGLPFAKLNTKESLFEQENFFTTVCVQNGEKFETLSLNKFSLSCEKGLKEIELTKKNYFFYNEFLYFNNLKMTKIEFEETEQIEHLNVYNYINFLGLNDLKHLINSEKENFNNLFINKFDNTQNGGLNYYDFITESEKKYKVNIEDEYFLISGNFIYDKKGKNTVKIDSGYCSLFHQGLFIKKIKIPADRYFYFCGLKFTKKTYELKEREYIFETEKDYSFLIKTEEEITNFLPYKIKNNSLYEVEKEQIELKYNGTSLFIENEYDFSKKAFRFSSELKKLKKFEEFQTVGKLYYTEGKFQMKNGVLTALEELTVIYTKKIEGTVDLVLKNGKFSELMLEKEGNEIFLKISKSGLEVTSNKHDSDFSVKLPSIQSLIIKNENETIFVIDSSELIVQIKNDETLKITDVVDDVPLFDKIVLEGVTDTSINLFYGSDIMVPHIKKIKDNNLEFYFNKKVSENYFCKINNNNVYVRTNPYHISDEEIIKFIDKNAVFEEKLINKLTVSYSDVLKDGQYIEFFIKNTLGKNVTRLELENKDIGQEIETNLYCDEISVSSNFELKTEKLGLSISNSKSFLQDELLYFIKENESDVIYYKFSNENKEVVENKDMIVGNFYNNKNSKSNDWVYRVKNISEDDLLIEPINRIAIKRNTNKNIVPFKNTFFDLNFKSVESVSVVYGSDTKIKTTREQLELS